MKPLKFEAIKDNEDNVYPDLEENLGAEEENININPPTEEEIKQVLKETKNWKATGSDNITPKATQHQEYITKNIKTFCLTKPGVTKLCLRT